jgi:hypothetical protein
MMMDNREGRVDVVAGYHQPASMRVRGWVGMPLSQMVNE